MLGPLIAAGGTLLSGYLNNQAAASRQEDAQEFSAQQFASRYQTTVKDMQAAGLNPMLAYTQGGGTAPTSSAASSAGYGDLGQTVTQSKIASAQIANVEADTQNKKTQTANIEADTRLKIQQSLTSELQGMSFGASADQARAQINYLEHSARKIAEEIKNIPKTGEQIDALVRNLGRQYELLTQQTSTEEQRTEQLKWMARKAMLEGDLVTLDVQAAKALDNIGRESAQLKPIVDMIRLLMRR